MPGALLKITEICAADEGFLIDEQGHVEDWIEIANVSGRPVDLGAFSLQAGRSRPQRLPARVMGAGDKMVLFADGAPHEGERHLAFKLAREGETVTLISAAVGAIDAIEYPPLQTNEVFARFPDPSGAFQKCRYASPGKPNGDQCGPPAPPALPAEIAFESYAWPTTWPGLPAPLAITELALSLPGFVEVVNTSAEPIVLDGFRLRLAPHVPGVTWPGPDEGRALSWPKATIQPGERMTVSISEEDVAALATVEREGVATLFRASDRTAIDRVDFMHIPDGAALARTAHEGAGVNTFLLCANATPGRPTVDCAAPPERAVGDRLRRLATPADFHRLAQGGTDLDSEAVKFVIDLEGGEVVHFLSSRAWALHYSFVRESIERQPRLNRCDPQQAAMFDAGWRQFSEREYLTAEGRRFLLATLVKYGGSGLQTVEFARGDVITGVQMRRAFFAVAARVSDPTRWAVRPQGPDQVEAVRKVEGTLPLVDPNAPFRGVTFQPVNTGVAYGVLRFVAGPDLATAALGPDVIVVTDDVPNDIALTGGLITEAFQTPLAHVAVLSKNRGAPNMALVQARKDARLAPFFDKLVRLQVTGAGFLIREAAAAEAEEFWQQRRPRGPRREPQLDTSVRQLVDLEGRGLSDLPIIGGKAAQLAELMRVRSADPACWGAVPVPRTPFAVTLVHSLEHFRASGAAEILQRWRQNLAFAVDPRARAQGLAEVRNAIHEHPVDATLIQAIERVAGDRFGKARFRLRSSSNTEDLPGFSGAGLYTSLSAALGDPERTVPDGLRTVWASLWDQRAYDERELALVDHDRTAMGVLVHEAFSKIERANGVAVSRDLLDPTRSSTHTINAQAGEASVTNPAPGVSSDQMTYTWYQIPPIVYRTRSSLVSEPVLKPPEVAQIGCWLRAIHDHFRAALDPMGKDRWFSVEAELKLIGPDRRLIIKQARPYSFGVVEIPVDCREI